MIFRIKSKEDLGIVMAYEEKWFKDFHGAIASDSAQTLMEAMSNVPIPGKPGEILTHDGVFSYSSELVGLWQSASPVIRNKPAKPTVIKMVTEHWWVDLRWLVEGGKVAGEDSQAVTELLLVCRLWLPRLLNMSRLSRPSPFQSSKRSRLSRHLRQVPRLRL